ncbi:uncharacterized protein LOC119549500 [Drosophila subpulchrella]|uniref:uncharacterized protein LOC119549500 n=1 Tax=Drosophila subpulchrella TaxID=1486046 RepID=UPI0018A19C64|nr:uncharacterized protein LOC119549500 [Drosophila subpulchrella]
MDFKYHNKDVVLEIKGSDALFHNTSILDVLKSLKELSEPAGDANSGPRVPKRRREEEEPKTPEKKGRKLSFDDVGFQQSNSFEELEASGSSQSPSSLIIRGAGGRLSTTQGDYGQFSQGVLAKLSMFLRFTSALVPPLVRPAPIGQIIPPEFNLVCD